MDRIPQLGRLITDEQFRDAVHIAVAPVIAGMPMYPGEHIGFIGDAYTVGTNAPKFIGIVDPYLPPKVEIEKGQKFYMFLYPQTITSLRHEWTHPEFEKEAELAQYEPTFYKLKSAVEEIKWVTEFAERINTTYDDLMEAAKNYLETGEYFCQGGDFEGTYIPDEFWEKYEVITRETVHGSQRNTFLTCSC